MTFPQYLSCSYAEINGIIFVPKSHMGGNLTRYRASRCVTSAATHNVNNNRWVSHYIYGLPPELILMCWVHLANDMKCAGDVGLAQYWITLLLVATIFVRYTVYIFFYPSVYESVAEQSLPVSILLLALKMAVDGNVKTPCKLYK